MWVNKYRFIRLAKLQNSDVKRESSPSDFTSAPRESEFHYFEGLKNGNRKKEVGNRES